MSIFQVLTAVIAAIVLFLVGLQSLSRELREVGGETLTRWLGQVTGNRWLGYLLGAGCTAIVQSSSAVTALTVALVDSGAMTFRASLGVIAGANLGTTATAWLVSLKLSGFGPILIIAGALLGALPIRAHVFGRAVFFFGFVFFSLDLIADALEPLRSAPALQEWMAMASQPLVGVVAGALLTAVVQSSSVTTGLAIVLVQSGSLPAEAAVPIVLGANIGTTSTALVASLSMGRAARLAAIANFVFNAIGVVVYLPFIAAFAAWVVGFAGSPAMAVAWATMLFNLSIGIVFVAFLGPFERLFLRLVGEPPAAVNQS
jgi:Na/Pi-cotransporter